MLPLLVAHDRSNSDAGEASWTPIADDGRGGAGEAVELGQDDKDDDLKIELHTDVGQVASAVVRVADVWAVGFHVLARDSALMTPASIAWERFQKWTVSSGSYVIPCVSSMHLCTQTKRGAGALAEHLITLQELIAVAETSVSRNGMLPV